MAKIFFGLIFCILGIQSTYAISYNGLSNFSDLWINILDYSNNTIWVFYPSANLYGTPWIKTQRDTGNVDTINILWISLQNYTGNVISNIGYWWHYNTYNGSESVLRRQCWNNVEFCWGISIFLSWYTLEIRPFDKYKNNISSRNADIQIPHSSSGLAPNDYMIFLEFSWFFFDDPNSTDYWSWIKSISYQIYSNTDWKIISDIIQYNWYHLSDYQYDNASNYQIWNAMLMLCWENFFQTINYGVISDCNISGPTWHVNTYSLSFSQWLESYWFDSAIEVMKEVITWSWTDNNLLTPTSYYDYFWAIWYYSWSWGTWSTTTDYFADCTSFLDVGCYVAWAYNGIVDKAATFRDSVFSWLLGLLDPFRVNISWNQPLDTCGVGIGTWSTSGSWVGVIQRMTNVLHVLNPMAPSEWSSICTLWWPWTVQYAMLIPEENFWKKYLHWQIDPRLESTGEIAEGINFIDLITIIAFAYYIFHGSQFWGSISHWIHDTQTRVRNYIEQKFYSRKK